MLSLRHTKQTRKTVVETNFKKKANNSSKPADKVTYKETKFFKKMNQITENTTSKKKNVFGNNYKLFKKF